MSQLDSEIVPLHEEKLKLTDREVAIIRLTAEYTQRKFKENFFKHVGETFFTRVLTIVGGLVVAFALGKGWIPFSAK